MTNKFQILNAFQKKIIDFSNEQGISLAAEFGTVDEFKKFVVSFCIHLVMETGKTVQEAYDIVLGDGAYEQMADQVWATLKAA